MKDKKPPAWGLFSLTFCVQVVSFLHDGMEDVDVTKKHTFFLDLLLLTLFAGFVFTFMAGERPLSAPDEGRYTEIAREMVATNDFVTPRLNGVKYFEKPPFVYWMTALTQKIFGTGEGAMRLVPALMGLLGLLGVYAFGRRFFGREAGVWASVLLATNLLYFALSRLLILDMAVCTWMALSLMSFGAAYHETHLSKRRVFLGGFFVSMALAVLTKGLIGAVLPGCVILVWAACLRDWAPVRLAFTPWGIGLFFLIAAPWHILAAVRNPEFVQFYFIHEHFERYLTTVHGRFQPFWFFAPILLAGLLPWTPFVVRGVQDLWGRIKQGFFKREREEAPLMLLVIWAVFMFVFFSLSKSKLIPYILCIFHPLALMGGVCLARRGVSQGETQGLSKIMAGLMWLLAVAVPIALFIQGALGDTSFAPVWLILVVFLGAMGACFLCTRTWTRVRLLSVFSSLGLLFLLNFAWPYLDTRSVKSFVPLIEARMKEGDTLVTFERYYQDLPPYLGHTVNVVNWQGELAFGMSVEDTSAWMMSLAQFLKVYRGGGVFYIITSIDFVPRLEALLGEKLMEVARTRKEILLTSSPRP